MTQSILEKLKGGLVVSCQALENEPLHSSYIMSRMAYAAYLGGAVGIRANTIEDIIEIKKVVDLPIIGIIKAEYEDSQVYITPTLKEVQAPDTLREALAKSIKEYEKNRTDAPSEESEEIGISIEEFCEKLSKEDRESYFRWRAAEEKKKAKKARKRFHFPRKKRAVFVVAATMVLVLGIGMTSLGGRPYWLKVADLVLGNENTVTVDTEGEDRILTTDVSEKEAYEQIKEELGIEPVQLQYMPAGMEFDSFSIDTNVGVAKLFYLYDQKVFQYEMYVQKNDFSRSLNSEDKVIDEYTVDNGEKKIVIKELVVLDKKEYIAFFEEKQVFYKLMGHMDRADFEKIIKNLFFS